MTYPSYDPTPVFFDTLGLTAKPCAGGSLTFCEVGTTTEKETWSDPGQTTPNANPVKLDSSGRADTHIWLDDAYTIIGSLSRQQHCLERGVTQTLRSRRCLAAIHHLPVAKNQT